MEGLRVQGKRGVKRNGSHHLLPRIKKNFIKKLAELIVNSARAELDIKKCDSLCLYPASLLTKSNAGFKKNMGSKYSLLKNPTRGSTAGGKKEESKEKGLETQKRQKTAVQERNT